MIKNQLPNQQNLFSEYPQPVTPSMSHATWARLVKTRDGYICANTEKYPDRDHSLFTMNAHHITPKKFGGENKIDNGITYCRACHAAEHPEFQMRFTEVFVRWYIRIKDFTLSLFGLNQELPYYEWLKFLTGKLAFRPLQLEAIKAIVEAKKHVFVVMPTGSGKSIIYQIPGLMEPQHPSLVISPLKALQADQVYQLLSNWIPATYINSSLYGDELVERIKCIRENLFRFVFIHPKQLLSFENKTQELNVRYNKPLASAKINHLVVDEVHVMASQGLSFVKEYYHLAEIHKLYGQPQVIMMTATASKKTRDFIIERMGLGQENVTEFVTGFERPEITLEVYKVNRFDSEQAVFIAKDDALIHLLENKPPGKTIIFVTTKKEVEAVASLLTEHDYEFCKYHGGLTDDEKEISSKTFMGLIKNRASDIMVATSAFGMGINIPNIHQVIHYSLPFSLTEYYQQFGRAGRDGQASVAQLLYDEQNAMGMINFINGKTLEKETDLEMRQLLLNSYLEESNAFKAYIDAPDKWQYILDYFGQPKEVIGTINWWLFLALIALLLLAIFGL